ncbi:MAG: hypothetical protein HKL79_04220 [Thermoplasmata archaeon]|nr:hypothetical protein [Thermoplasmata archaeon]
MTDGAAPERLWVVLRQGPLGADEEAILAALDLAAKRDGVRLRSVVLGTASYAAEGASTSSAHATAPLYVLEEEHRGRGLRRGPGRPTEAVSYAQIVTWLFQAEKVISFP